MTHTGHMISDLQDMVDRHLARLKENPPSEQEWQDFLNDGLPVPPQEEAS